MRFVGFFVLLLASCSGAPAAPPAKPLRDFRGIIHCHSKYSHDSKGTYEEILAAAKAAKVDFICITDHPPKDDAGLSLREGWTGMHDGVLFIQGHELAGKNLLALGIKEPVGGETPRERIEAIHRQGGLAFVSHPEEVTDWEPYLGADGMEIYNVHATLKRKAKDKTFMFQVAKALKEDPENSFRLLQELDPPVLKKWDEINQKRRFVGIAGNDSHQNVSFFGYQLDPYPRAFKAVSTHVRAEELTQTAILSALKAGNCYVEFGRTWAALPGDDDAKLPGKNEAVTVVHDWEQGKSGEFPGVDAIGYRGHHRLEWHVLKPDGRLPWILMNPVGSPPRRP